MCLVAAAFFGAATDVCAATGVSQESQTELPAGILIGDENGIHVDQSGYYHIDARNLRPGDIVHKTLILQNMTHSDQNQENKAPYHLSMTAEPLTAQGPVDLLDKVSLTLALDGKIIYQGPSRGNGFPNMIEKALDLGAYNAGDRRTLEITLNIDPAMGLSAEKSEADFKWHFYAYRAKEEEGPKTGILKDYGYFLPIGGVLLLCALLVPLKKRRDGRKSEMIL